VFLWRRKVHGSNETGNARMLAKPSTGCSPTPAMNSRQTIESGPTEWPPTVPDEFIPFAGAIVARPGKADPLLSCQAS
jgi:hypothetical protein